MAARIETKLLSKLLPVCNTLYTYYVTCITRCNLSVQYILDMLLLRVPTFETF